MFPSVFPTTWTGSEKKAGSENVTTISLSLPTGRRPAFGNMRRGGKVLIVSAAKPEFEVAPVVHSMADVKGSIRVRDHGAFPSLKDADLLLLNGPFTELEPDPHASLTLVPLSMIGPPEFVHIDMKDTDTPAIAVHPAGKGTVVWIPWNLGALYYRHSLPAHEGLFRDVLDRLVLRRQIRTDAHPLVEMTLMKQGSRTLLHLINLTGTRRPDISHRSR